MAEQKRPSVAEILAAARKADSKGGAEQKADEQQSAAATPAAEASQPGAAEAPVTPAQKAPAAKPAAARAPGERPSVAEILAAARNKTPAASATPAPKPAASPAAAASKAPAAKAGGAAKAAPAARAAAPAAKDTASILAAARKSVKPGPMSKAEAAIKAPAAKAPAKPEKARVVVPPMPPKPDYAKPKPAPAATEDRRSFLWGVALGSSLGIGFTSLATTFGLWTLGTARFMFPNILTEPPSQFKVGFPSNFAPGQVETKFIAQYGVWVVNWEYEGQPQIYALKTVCTHLGCTPNWLEGEQKFKCPCHGSGFYKDGINFEGPAPRPLERYAIRLADDGQLEIDKSKTFQEEIGQWKDPASFVAV